VKTVDDFTDFGYPPLLLESDINSFEQAIAIATSENDNPWSMMGDADDTYTRLKRKFRLVKIENYDEQQNVLKCTLAVHDLKTAPRYVALSYTWTADVHDTLNVSRNFATILLNDRPFKVKENLRQFFYSHWKEYQGCPMWVDVFCIDQDNRWERDYQVKKIAEIFSKSIRLVIWLGPADASVAVALQVQDDMIQMIQRLRLSTNNHVDAISNMDFSSTCFNNGLVLPPSNAMWHCWFKLLRRSWFSRVWTLQEWRMCKPTAGSTPDREGDHMLCGDLDVSIIGLHVVLYYVLNSMSFSKYHPEVNEMRGILEHAYRFLSIYRQEPNRLEHAEWPTPVYATLPETSGHVLNMQADLAGCSCTNPRDRLFSAVRIHNTAGNLVDYQAPLEQLWYAFAVQSIRFNPLLDYLSFVEDSRLRTASSQPSWVADFGVKCTTRAEPIADLMMQGELVFSAGLCLQNRSYSARRIDGQRLILKGKRIARIAAVLPLEEEITMPDLIWLLSFCSMIRGRLPQHPVESLWRTLIANHSSDQYPSPDLSQEFGLEIVRIYYSHLLEKSLESSTTDRERDLVFEDILEHLNKDLSLRQKLPSLVETRRNLRRQEDSRKDSFKHDLQDLLARRPTDTNKFRIAAKYRNRSIFMTRDNVLGLGPFSCAMDEVWLLEDARVPFILRPKPDSDKPTFSLIGESYVHGIMHGECVECDEEGVVASQFKEIILV